MTWQVLLLFFSFRSNVNTVRNCHNSKAFACQYVRPVPYPHPLHFPVFLLLTQLYVAVSGAATLAHISLPPPVWCISYQRGMFWLPYDVLRTNMRFFFHLVFFLFWFARASV